MPCLVPFTNSNLDASFLVFKPVGFSGEDLIDSLKYFSFCVEYQGCAYSSVFKSIHGNMVIWYGAWMKRSDDKKKLLNSTLTSVTTSLSSMAVLKDFGFFEAYGGESKDGHPAAKFSSGDIVSISATLPVSDALSNLSYTYLALLKSWFFKMEGVSAGVCFRSYDNPKVASLHVWKSLCAFYSWFLSFNFREAISPYIDHLSLEMEHDVFRVVYVNNDDTLAFRLFPPLQLTANQDINKENRSSESSHDSNLNS